jgi:hypothetical protein
MPQTGSSLADEIIGGVNKVRQFIENIHTPFDAPTQHVDPKDVEAANASFRRQAESEAKAKKQGHSYKAAQAEHSKQAARK